MAGLARGRQACRQRAGTVSAEAGEQLRAARLQKGLSEADVAAALKVPVRYIEALDRGDLSCLPEQAFVRGYVRSYARMVGIDAEAMCALLTPVEIKAPRPQVGIADMPGRRPVAGVGRRPGRLSRHHRIAGLVLVVVGAGLATWTAYEPETGLSVDTMSVVPLSAVEGDAGVAIDVPLPDAVALDTGEGAGQLPPPTDDVVSEQSPVPVALPTQHAVDTSSSAAAARVAGDIPRAGLYVRFSGDCWIEVRDADNAILHHATGTAGKDLKLTGKAPLVVTLGNAGRAELWWNGEPVKVDAFSRAGVARVNLGRPAR